MPLTRSVALAGTSKEITLLETVPLLISSVKKLQAQVLKLCANNIIVRSVKPPKESASSNGNTNVLRYGILHKDYDLLSKTISTVEQAIPIRELNKAARHRER